MPKRARTTFRINFKMNWPFRGRPSREILEASYNAFSRWSEMIYPKVIMATPTYKGTDPRRKPGFVRSKIKLMWTTGEKRIRFKAIGVPRGTIKGTPEYHALMAIYSMHYGWSKPFVRRPKASKVLTFPLKRGQRFRKPYLARPPPGNPRGRKRWIVTTKAVQKGGPKRNPFIHRVFRDNIDLYYSLLREELKKKGKERKVIEVSRS